MSAAAADNWNGPLVLVAIVLGFVLVAALNAAQAPRRGGGKQAVNPPPPPKSQPFPPTTPTPPRLP